MLGSSSISQADHPGGGFGGAGAGPISTMTGGTLARGQSAYALRMDYINFRRFSDAELIAIGAAGDEADSTDYSVGAFLIGAWGLTDDLTVGVRLPYIFMNDIREPENNMGMIGVENEGNSVGHGDIMALAQYRVLHWEDEKVDASVIGGLSFPTGLTSAVTRAGNVFEVEHQPGSGAWDPLVGVAASKSWQRLSFHTSALYRFATEGKQQTNLGDILNYGAAFTYRLGCLQDDDHDDHLHDHDHHHAPTLDLILEFNGLWSEKQVVAGVRDDNDGGNIIFVAPGARFNFGDGHSIFTSTMFPMAQNVNGLEHKTDFRLIVGASFVH